MQNESISLCDMFSNQAQFGFPLYSRFLWLLSVELLTFREDLLQRCGRYSSQNYSGSILKTALLGHVDCLYLLIALSYLILDGPTWSLSSLHWQNCRHRLDKPHYWAWGVSLGEWDKGSLPLRRPPTVVMGPQDAPLGSGYFMSGTLLSKWDNAKARYFSKT